ncbi:hypothetical protein [Sphingomonas sp. R86521]|uniref:hypothetical protein n=1 Tax=Sphingomonas sp. R86521 TaxID=3093860 RepID=UPI0036D3CD51
MTTEAKGNSLEAVKNIRLFALQNLRKTWLLSFDLMLTTNIRKNRVEYLDQLTNIIFNYDRSIEAFMLTLRSRSGGASSVPTGSSATCPGTLAPMAAYLTPGWRAKGSN